MPWIREAAPGSSDNDVSAGPPRRAGCSSRLTKTLANWFTAAARRHRRTAELEKLVARGGYACAFSMFPTSIEDLMSIADAGGIMPPKSTWFEPKLRDAMFCHLL